MINNHLWDYKSILVFIQPEIILSAMDYSVYRISQ